MEFQDDELAHFAEQGATPLPAGDDTGYVEHDGARIWYAAYGAGPAVILLHGGLGHAGNWGYQVPALVAAGYRAVVVDSRGHGRSTRDEKAYSYERMAADALAVMDRLQLAQAALIGWSDGACTALVMADRAPGRVVGVFFFACNMDPSGTKPFNTSTALDRCFARHRADYDALSATPGQFDAFVAAVSQMMTTQPNYSADDLARIRVPVTVALGEHDEFIEAEHVDYLARTIPEAKRITLPGVSHFAPLQRPALFNEAILSFLADLQRAEYAKHR